MELDSQKQGADASMAAHAAELDMVRRRIASQAEELARAREENGSLLEMLKQQQEQPAEKSFDPFVQERVSQLQQENANLLQRIQAMGKNEQQIEDDLSKANSENAEL